MAEQIERYRLVIPLVGNAAYVTDTIGVPSPGEIRTVFVTASAAEDAAATLGTTAATDVACQITDNATPNRILLSYALTPADPSLTIYSEEQRVMPRGTSLLTVGVILDAMVGLLPDATVVVEVEIAYKHGA